MLRCKLKLFVVRITTYTRQKILMLRKVEETSATVLRIIRAATFNATLLRDKLFFVIRTISP